MVVSAPVEGGGPMTLSTAVLRPGDLFVRRRESVIVAPPLARLCDNRIHEGVAVN
jgi:hypothetical protein